MKLRNLMQRAGLVIGGLLFFEVGARVTLPGLDVQALLRFIRNNDGGGLLGFYNWLGGGALSRGAVLALGIVPYFSAMIMMRLARLVSPSVEALNDTEAGHQSMVRVTRTLPVTLALTQSIGFALFVQRVPGAVADPGIGFMIRTTLTLTAGSLAAMLIGEQMLRPLGDEDDNNVSEPQLVAQVGSPAQEQLWKQAESEPIRIR